MPLSKVPNPNPSMMVMFVPISDILVIAMIFMAIAQSKSGIHFFILPLKVKDRRVSNIGNILMNRFQL